MAPKATASWTAIVPTAPDAPTMRTRSPGWTWPWSRSACSATNVGYGITAACSKDNCGGLGATLPTDATAYWANVPRLDPYTSSPGATVSTPGPITSTNPAKFVPG